MDISPDTPRFATFSAGGTMLYGAVAQKGMIALSTDFPQWRSLLDVVRAGGLDALARAAESRAATHTDFRYEMVLPDAPRIICVGVNFPDRNAEYRDGSAPPRYMSLFLRFASSFTGHGRPLIRPPENHTLDYEGELAIVIGKPGRRIRPRDAARHIAALTICNEGTIRDWVRHAKFNVTQGKNWDCSGALGPWLVPFSDPSQMENARIVTRVNGEIRQDDVVGRMIFPVSEEIAYISTFMTLQPGDIIITGTPTGAGARFDPPRYLAPGDLVEVEISGIGVLSNTVADE